MNLFKSKEDIALANVIKLADDAISNGFYSGDIPIKIRINEFMHINIEVGKIIVHDVDNMSSVQLVGANELAYQIIDKVDRHKKIDMSNRLSELVSDKSSAEYKIKKLNAISKKIAELQKESLLLRT